MVFKVEDANGNSLSKEDLEHLILDNSKFSSVSQILATARERLETKQKKLRLEYNP